MLALTIKGLMIGLAVAAPVGPMALLCLKLSLERGIMAGFATGLGIAIADMTYGILALLGLTAVMTLLLEHNDLIRSLGGSGLIIMAGFSVYKILRAPAVLHAAEIKDSGSKGLIVAFSSAYALTITNPMTILVFLAIFAGLNNDGSGEERWIVALGIFLGSLGWWLFIALLGSVMRKHLPTSFIKAIDWLSALVIGGFGFYILAS
ncbi:LysE family translocator [Kiloniella sp.]|uniref:LysE family translocator n=1 Tax=Kiloniella sp. TaxID=1938587 RepID=UPI003B028434